MSLATITISPFHPVSPHTRAAAIVRALRGACGDRSWHLFETEPGYICCWSAPAKGERCDLSAIRLHDRTWAVATTTANAREDGTILDFGGYRITLDDMHRPDWRDQLRRAVRDGRVPARHSPAAAIRDHLTSTSASTQGRNAA